MLRKRTEHPSLAFLRVSLEPLYLWELIQESLKQGVAFSGNALLFG